LSGTGVLVSQFGYAGVILRIDLSLKTVSRLPTSAYSERFLGGRGIAAKIYWDETTPQTGAFDPDNPVIFITGPVAGFTRFSGCRWQICGKSAQMQPEAFSYANLGGSWGAWLKFSGYDGLVVTGRAEKPVFILIDNGRVEIRDASRLWGQTTIETQHLLQAELGIDSKVLAIGPAGENRVTFATVLAAENASGSSGFGAILGSKNLKAVVVKADPKQRPVAADPEGLRSLADQVYQLRTRNFEDYGHLLPLKIRFTACYGCISGCTRGTYEAEGGRQFKVLCQQGAFYLGPAMKYSGKGAPEVNRLASRLCDMYGLDTSVLSPMISWLSQCYEAGILIDHDAGLPLSRIGSVEFIETLISKISRRQDFGDILARGTLQAADYVGKDSRNLLNSLLMSRSNEGKDHDPRLILVNSLLCAVEPRRPIQLVHAAALPLSRWMNWRNGRKDAFLSSEVIRNIAETFWGGQDGGDYSTYVGKALAAKIIQEYGYIKESLILCDLAWPIYQVHSPDKNLGLFSLESRILSAITGTKTDEAGLSAAGERIFNLQRAILIRQGWGGRKGDNLMGYLFQEPLRWVFYDPDCLVPDLHGNPVSRKGAIVEQDRFEILKDEYYALRGWDIESGLQTRSKLADLQLMDIAQELEKSGLVR
jgi:aldehyde:ferredoxin oxidoreductase